MSSTSWDVGTVRVTKVVEHDLRVSLNGLLANVPQGAAARHPWLMPDYVDTDGMAILSIHGFVIDTGARQILVDTCIGSLRDDLPFPPAGSGFCDALADAQYPVDTIDTVVCTHLHFDHVGWNTTLVDGAWVPTFPNARYVIGAPNGNTGRPGLTRTRTSTTRFDLSSRRASPIWSTSGIRSARRCAWNRRPATLPVRSA